MKWPWSRRMRNYWLLWWGERRVFARLDVANWNVYKILSTWGFSTHDSKHTTRSRCIKSSHCSRHTANAKQQTGNKGNTTIVMSVLSRWVYSLWLEEIQRNTIGYSFLLLSPFLFPCFPFCHSLLTQSSFCLLCGSLARLVDYHLAFHQVPDTNI